MTTRQRAIEALIESGAFTPVNARQIVADLVEAAQDSGRTDAIRAGKKQRPTTDSQEAEMKEYIEQMRERVTAETESVDLGKDGNIIPGRFVPEEEIEKLRDINRTGIVDDMLQSISDFLQAIDTERNEKGGQDE